MALTQIEQGMLKDGILTADTAGRLKVADGFVNAAKLASGAARANFGAGAVLQIVQSTLTAWTTTTNTSAVATGLAATITPASSSNKILIQITGASFYNASSANNIFLLLYKNGSFVAYLDWDLMSSIAYNGAGAAYSYLDSPATTSATTYQLYWASNTGATIGINNYAGAGTNNNRSMSSIILTEIAA